MVDTPREYPRYEVQAYVDYTGSDVLLYHRIQNLSLGGICIQTPTLEEVGTKVDVVVNFPDLQKEISLTGEVVWANREPPQDIGIRWIKLDDTRKALLREYLERVRTRT
jgi:uncharacterized protein (TIGR02266 family)